MFLTSTFALSANAETTITVGDPDKDGGNVQWEVTGSNDAKVKPPHQLAMPTIQHFVATSCATCEAIEKSLHNHILDR